MKIFLIALTFLFSFQLHADHKPIVVNVSLQKAYVPVGFDDNDRAQVTVAGAFTDTCFKVQDSGVMVDESTKTIQVWQTAYKYSGTCLRMFVPFNEVVNLGILTAGQYTIVDKLSSKEIGKLSVARATRPEPDDFLYAPINDAFFKADVSGDKELILVGEFSDTCSELADVKVNYYQESIVVQPTAMRKTGVQCLQVKVPFVKTIALDPKLTGTRLLHVRSMNGQAINKVVETDYIQ